MEKTTGMLFLRDAGLPPKGIGGPANRHLVMVVGILAIPEDDFKNLQMESQYVVVGNLNNTLGNLMVATDRPIEVKDVTGCGMGDLLCMPIWRH